MDSTSPIDCAPTLIVMLSSNHIPSDDTNRFANSSDTASERTVRHPDGSCASATPLVALLHATDGCAAAVPIAPTIVIRTRTIQPAGKDIARRNRRIDIAFVLVMADAPRE